MDQRIPQILHPLIQEYTDRVKQEIPGRMAAFYLEGSIALGEFNPRLSDIDFIAVLKGKATSPDFEKILRIHKKMERKYPWKLSGMYFEVGDLGCLGNTKAPFLNYHDGKLKWSVHLDLISVSWWILTNHGIAIIGPSAQSLPISLDLDQLVRAQHENLKTYWASWTTKPGRILALTSDWGVQWTVLGVSRQFYTIHEHKITSKIKAGEYALAHLPEYWHPILREAIALRRSMGPTSYHSTIRRAFDAFHYIRYVTRVCNDFLGIQHV
jgi:hypothetical protein